MKSILTGIILLALTGCATNQVSTPEKIGAATEAWIMQGKRVDLDNKDDWPDEIRELNPIDIYTDRVNVVIVTKRNGNIEEGYYINPTISSHLPVNDSKWTFIYVSDRISKFTRKRANKSG